VSMVALQYCYILYSETSTPIILIGYGPTLSLDSITTGRWIGRIFLVVVASKVLLQQKNCNPHVEEP
jgi:hypothetical protein